MFISREQNAGQNHDIKIGNSLNAFKNLMKFKSYLRVISTDLHCMHEEIKSHLKSGNASCHSAQNPLSSRLLLRT